LISGWRVAGFKKTDMKTKVCNKCKEEMPIAEFCVPGARCKKCVALYQKKWHKKNYEINKNEIIKKTNAYYHSHKKEYNSRRRAKDCKRWQNDPMFRIKSNDRRKVRKLLVGQQKAGSAVRDIGCTGKEFRAYIASLFTAEMSWANYGTYWHLDHIFPLSAANLKDRTEFLAVSNYRNRQPMEAKQNISKNDTITPAAQALFDSLCHELGTQEKVA
jgi:hypothetical protein